MAWDSYYERSLGKSPQPAWTRVEEYVRLPLACFGGPLFVISLFWLGMLDNASLCLHGLLADTSHRVDCTSRHPLDCADHVSAAVWCWLLTYIHGRAELCTFAPLLQYPMGSEGLLTTWSRSSTPTKSSRLAQWVSKTHRCCVAIKLMLLPNVAGAASCSRSLFGVILPFAAKPMYERLGIGWACSLLGFLSLLMALIPFVFIKFGDRIRANSKFCQELKQQKQEKEAAEQRRRESRNSVPHVVTDIEKQV